MLLKEARYVNGKFVTLILIISGSFFMRKKHELVIEFIFQTTFLDIWYNIMETNILKDTESNIWKRRNHQDHPVLKKV